MSVSLSLFTCTNVFRSRYKLPDPVSAPGKSPVRAGDVEGRCSGDWTSGLIVDQIAIPADLKPGAYVLGWYATTYHLLFAIHTDLCSMRMDSTTTSMEHGDAVETDCAVRRWDCEETTQVWSSCAGTN